MLDALGIIVDVMKKKILVISALFVILVATLGVPVSHVSAANTVTAGDLISLINSIRTSNGNPALKENSILDGTAQATAEEMADEDLSGAIGNVKGRIAAAGYASGANFFATENWAAYQDGATLSWLQSVWSDAEHMIPMLNPYYKDIGAGVATSSSGRVVYIVHAAYIVGGSYAESNGGDTSSTATESVSQIMMPVVTSTPHADGSVVHGVLQGQTLWSIAIAYGTHINIISALNGLSGTYLYVGEQLLMPSAMPTIIPTITPTILTPTSTITPTRMLPTMDLTSGPTLLPSKTPAAASISVSEFVLDRRTLGIIIIIICALGLGVAMFTALRGK